MTISGKKIERKPLLIAICVFLSFKPFFVWTAPNIFMMGVLPAILLATILPTIDLKSHSKNTLFTLFFALFIALSIIQDYNIAFSLFTISMAFIPFVERMLLKKAMNYLNIISGFMLAGAVIFWVLRLIDVPLPSYQIASLNSGDEALFANGYTAYPPFLVMINFSLEFFRMYGPFDEPGVVGTLCLLLLYINEYDFKKWYNEVFLVAGLCAASFVFVGGSLFYMFYYLFTTNRRMGLLILVFIALFYVLTKDSPVMNALFYSRMEWDASEGKFAGDTRFFDYQKDYVFSMPSMDFWFGDHGKSAGEFTGSRSYLDAIIEYGAFFCLNYLLLFFFFALRSKLSMKSIILFAFLILLILYQRPNFVHIGFMFLFSSYIITRTDSIRYKQDAK